MPEGMTPTERRLREERQNIWEGTVKPLVEKVNSGTSLTVEERKAAQEGNARITAIQEELKLVEGYNAREQGRDELADTRGVSRDALDGAEKRYEDAYVRWFRYGERGLNEADRQTLELRAPNDPNALSTAPGAPAAGATGFDAGYMVPQGFWQNLQIALKAYGGLLNRARVLNTATGQPMPWPTVDPTAIIGSYITELNPLGFGGDSAGTDYQFGQGMLSAWTIVSGVILASIQLIQDSAFDVNQFVSDRMGEAIGRKVAQELHSGTGSSALLGIETALAARGKGASPGLGGVYKSGTSTNWANTAGGFAWQLYQTASGTGDTSIAKLANKLIGFDDILGMILTVDPAYRALGNCAWVTNDVTYQMLRGITDAFAHPIWNPDPRVGTLDNIYGYPVVIDQNTSNVSTVASTVGGLLFGDFTRAMVVRQVNGAGSMRLTERYADFLQVGFLGWVRMDARSNDLRAAALYSTNAT